MWGNSLLSWLGLLWAVALLVLASLFLFLGWRWPVGVAVILLALQTLGKAAVGGA